MSQQTVVTVTIVVAAVFFSCGLVMAQSDAVVHSNLIIAEGEKFTPQDSRGWKLTRQADSWASHTYGGMWVTHGALLGAPHHSAGSIATQAVVVPVSGKYRVWSKYQSMPYFSYAHQVEIVQNGRTVFSHVYGKPGAPRFYSFAGAYQMKPVGEVWWPWGVDHDAAEAPEGLVELQAGPAEIRLITVKADRRAADPMVDFVLLTTQPADDYRGYQPYQAGSPFTYEALSATQLYIRFKNTTKMTTTLQLRKPIGHYQPIYNGWSKPLPETAEPGQWSAWTNIGPDLNLVHDEGLLLRVDGATTIPVQLALDGEGRDIVGDVEMANGQALIIPKEITWDPEAVVKTADQHARQIRELCHSKWRTANGGKKPQQLAYFGSMTNGAVKDALGYNTQLPDHYDHLRVDGYFCHVQNPDQIRSFADTLNDRSRHRVLSFGDEIRLGTIDYNSGELQQKYTKWLTEKGYTEKELGVNPELAQLRAAGDPRQLWFANLFNEQERFASFRSRTELAEQLLGSQVLTGANYSPHHLALCYGPVFQWVDIFKHRGMSMFWSEDYIFSIPEVPQILSWMIAQARCGVKYHNLPIHMYIMPHAPGQTPGFLRRNMVYAVGAGAAHIDSFLVGPMEQCTENFVSWGSRETFRVLHESIFDSGEAESLQVNGKMRPARVGLVLSKATDFNESRLNVPKAWDPFVSRCDNGPEQINQIICRKDQQMLYLALRHSQHGVELITEDDIVDLEILEQFDVVYFAGEWVDERIVPRLDRWIDRGGVLYATAGIGHLNQFNQPSRVMRELLGLEEVHTKKNLYVVRTLLELPLVEPIDQIRLEQTGETSLCVDAVGMRQSLVPLDADVVGRWSDGSAAVTVRKHGRGKAFAVGTLAGNSYMKTALHKRPFARGGRKTVYNPTAFGAAATVLVRLGIDAVSIDRQVVCSNPFVEANVLDSPRGTLLTLVNWSDQARLDGLEVVLKLPAEPRYARSVEQQKNVQLEYSAGTAVVTTDLTEADYILLPRDG